MASPLARLVAGTPAADCDLGQALIHIGDQLDILSGQITDFHLLDDPRAVLFGPFIGRSVLELAMTGLTGRLDPFRILVLREMQRQGDYEVGERHFSSFQWQGDVMVNKPSKSDLWSSTVSFEQISRALLGDYFDHLVWQSALRRLMDATTEIPGGLWLSELRLIDAGTLVKRFRPELSRIYSGLSKGIHHEFVIPAGPRYDRPAILTLLQDTLKYVTQLCMVSHAITHGIYGLEIDEAVLLGNQLENVEVN